MGTRRACGFVIRLGNSNTTTEWVQEKHVGLCKKSMWVCDKVRQQQEEHVGRACGFVIKLGNSNTTTEWVQEEHVGF